MQDVKVYHTIAALRSKRLGVVRVGWTAGSKVLITGGAGFIGSHLCERFHAQGWRVMCLDNLHTGRTDNIKSLIGSPRFEFIEHDITSPYATDDGDIKLILNFACPASPVHYQQDPLKTIRTNVLGTMNMLDLAKQSGARFFQASTSEVYGDPLEHPQTERYWGNVNPIGIRSCYDEGKRIAETLCFDYHRSYQVDIRVVRIFNTYGPRMCEDDGRVVSSFIVQALRGQDLSIFGNGEQTRSFCYVDDLVDGIVSFALNGTEMGPINIGNDQEFTVRELAEEIIRQVDPNLKTCSMPLPSDDPKLRCPDLTLAKKYLNYAPKVQLVEGLQKTIKWFRSQS